MIGRRPLSARSPRCAQATIVVAPPPDAATIAALEHRLLDGGALTVERVDEDAAVRWIVALWAAEPARLVARVLAQLGLDHAAVQLTAAASDDRASWPWRRRVAPTIVGPLVLVEASAGEVPAEGLVVRIEPGMALGTATNAATVMCLEWLVDNAARARSLLDVGTGTGILALSAIRLGVARVVGVDIDPEARAMAAENAALNGLTLDVPRVPVRALEERFDIVVCNIITELLIPLAPALAARCDDGGVVVLGGARVDEIDQIAAAYAPFGLAVVETRARDGVTVLALRA